MTTMTTTCCHHDHNLLQPVKEVKVPLLSALPQGCSDEGLLFLEADTVVLLSSFGSKFGELGLLTDVIVALKGC